MAKVIGIRHAKISNDTTVYDPTCGSGSLLLKIARRSQARRQGRDVTLYGQEMDNATAGLARMNMILHDYATAEIRQDNTLASPHFNEGDALKTFDFVVANPPFPTKRGATASIPSTIPGNASSLRHPARQRTATTPSCCTSSLAQEHRQRRVHSPARRAVPRRRRGRSSARNLVQRGYIKGIIGLPANLFYGTGIPACIVVLDKENATPARASS